MGRRIVIFGIGAPKSGTHSLAGLFEANYRTAHEPEAKDLVEMICDVREGLRPREDLRRLLAEKFERLDLEVDCAGLNGWVVEDLVPLSDRARFILTIRDPYTWLDSMLNHMTERDAPAHYVRLRKLNLGGHPFRAEDRALQERGLYPLDGYLASWATRNQLALDAVPAGRLLVVPTDQLGDRVVDIATFAGIDPATLDRSRSHQFLAPVKYGILDDLDQAYLRDRIEAHCRPLIDRFFPDTPLP
jgi:hypothetical protein